MNKIGFGGGCHWCTEAVFQQVAGVSKVDQGWIASESPNDVFSEAVVVHFDPEQIHLRKLILIHLKTHSCTSAHSMRKKYRSAIYTFYEEQAEASLASIKIHQEEFESPILTSVLPFVKFKENKEVYRNYYQKNPEKAFCVRYIEPKLKWIKDI